MKRAFAIVLIAFTSSLLAAETSAPREDWLSLLHEAQDAARTNSSKALTLCERAIAAAPTNGAPYAVRATIFEAQRDYDKALRDASEAIRLAPKSVEGWQLRGVVNFKSGKFKESVSDFDRVLALAPKQAPYHWQRGISLYYAGDFVGGRKQFELHESVNPNDVENAVWHFLCVARSEGAEAARKKLLKPGPDARVPMKEVLALFAGSGTAEQVIGAASIASSSDALFYAHLYLGLYYDALKDTTRTRQHITKAVTLAPDHYMGDVARIHAAVLKAR
jgi:lipoprotein NlpI